MARKTVSDDFRVFSERLSDLMKERGLKQQDLADVLGIKRQTVSLYMTGQSMPDAEQAKNIASKGKQLMVENYTIKSYKEKLIDFLKMN